MNRYSLVGATAQQLVELDKLFPHNGRPQNTVQQQQPAPRSRHLLHDTRQIRVVTSPRAAIEARREMVGAYTEVQDGGNWKELGLPLSGVAGVTIAALATADFELKPNRLFLPGVLSIDKTIAPLLIMSGLTIGGHNCLLNTGAIQCSAFANDTLHKPFSGWAASNAQPITFSLKNVHATLAQIVWGVWWGMANDE